MSKFTIISSILFLLLIGIAGFFYYFYVLDIEYHENFLEGSDEFNLKVTAPKNVKKNQRFSVLAELQYTGNEAVTVERQNPAIRIDMVNKEGEHVYAYSPIAYMRNNENYWMRPFTVFTLNLEYKIKESGEYTILIDRRFFKMVDTGEVLGDLAFTVPVQVGKR